MGRYTVKFAARAFIEKMRSDEAFRYRIMAIEAIDARLAADCLHDAAQLTREPANSWQ